MPKKNSLSALSLINPELIIESKIVLNPQLLSCKCRNISGRKNFKLQISPISNIVSEYCREYSRNIRNIPIYLKGT